MWWEGRLFVAVFDGDVSGPMVRRYALIQGKAADAAPGQKLIPLTFVRGGSPSVDEDVRRESADFLNAAERYTDVSAVVMSVPGMLGTIIRGVLTGILMVARTPYALRVFSSGAEAAEWLGAEARLDSAEVATLAKLIRAAS